MKNTLNLTDIVNATLRPKYTGMLHVLVDKYGIEIKAHSPAPDVFRLILPHKSMEVLQDGVLYTFTPGKYEVPYRIGVAQRLIKTL